MAKQDYYELLGIGKTASADEIKKAYRQQAVKWHPDKHPQDKEEAEKQFKKINEAYQVLSDPQKRQTYDQVGHDAFSSGSHSSGARNGPFSYTYSSSSGSNPFSGFDFGDPFDIFEQFFSGGSAYRPQRLPKYSMAISFEDSIHGVQKVVEISGKKHKVKIPAGINSGAQIKFDNFILVISVRPHDSFERDGDDLYTKVYIPFSIVSLGGSVEVSTLDEKLEVKIKSGTPSGSMLRLKGKGVKRLRGSGRGDLYMQIVVRVPDKLSREQKKLMNELKKHDL